MPAVASYPDAASFHANAKLLGTDENGVTKNFTKAQVQGGIDHGGLSGLTDDNHTQYSKADGTRDFSGKVKYTAHPTFSADTELVDKKYVDDAIIAGGGYTDAQAQDAVGNILNATRFTYNDGAGTIDLSAGTQTSLGKADSALQAGDIGDTVQAHDEATLKSDTSTNLTVGYTATADDDGTLTTGTYTPDPAGGNLKRYINGGAHTFAAPTAGGDYTLIVQITNNGSAGAISFTGFSKAPSGDALTTTNGHDFFVYITKINGFVHGQIVALQ